jgi:hypothetical protein
MTRSAIRRVTATLAAALVALLPAAASAQAPAPPGKPGARGRPAPAAAPSAAEAATRFRLVLNGAAALGTQSYDDVRTPIEYAERASIRTSYETGTGLGFDAALQVSLFRGLGVLAGYSYTTRDATGSVDVSRPHPLYLDRPRSASAELAGYGYSEGALDLDLAFARSAGALDWALFAGVTLFQVQADLLDVPTYEESYPYDELRILSTPARAVEESATGWNVGGRLDYRFGQSRRFGMGVQLRYSSASVALTAGQDATAATIDAGGLAVGAGVRLYF